MSNKFELLLEQVEDAKANYEKFRNGNKAAGTRARKALQSIRNLSLDVRKEISEAKNS